MSDMGFLASRFRGESFPLSIIECLFSGNPFIASDIGEIRNMLTTQEGMAGAVFELDDWKIPVIKVAQIVAEFAPNPDIYQQARALAERAAQPFCMDNIIADYEKAYQQVLSSSSAIAIL